MQCDIREREKPTITELDMEKWQDIQNKLYEEKTFRSILLGWSGVVSWAWEHQLQPSRHIWGKLVPCSH